MKHLIYMAVLLMATTSLRIAHAGGQEIRTCEFKVKARCESGDASVTLADGVVTRVEVSVYRCGLPGKLGYSCTIDSSRSDRDSIWSEDGGATLIDNASPFNSNEPDRIKVTAGQYVSIDLDKAQSLGRCGVGADLPRAIAIPAQRGACRVRLGPP